MVDHTLMATVPVSDLCRIECINIMTDFVYVYSYLHDDHSSCLQMCMYGTRKKKYKPLNVSTYMYPVIVKCSSYNLTITSL